MPEIKDMATGPVICDSYMKDTCKKKYCIHAIPHLDDSGCSVTLGCSYSKKCMCKVVIKEWEE